MKNKLTAVEKSWITYDWANSVYATIILAAVFPIYFSGLAAKACVPGDVWWGWATSAATFLMALIAPVIGAIGDYKGMKKRLFIGFLLLGLVFTTLMALTDRLQLMLVGYILSYMGFMGANLFYDSFLTDITTPDRMDMVSAWGFAMGYIGGSSIPFIISILLISLGERIGVDGVAAVKLSVLLAVLWWGGFSIPMLRKARQVHYVEVPLTRAVRNTLRSIWETARGIVNTKAILVFLIAYFFYIDGVNTVINMATSYGSTLGLDTTGMILALMVTQFVAFPFSILFSRFSRRIGSINMIGIAIGVYFVICILGFVMGFGIEQGFFTTAEALRLFWLLAVLVGTCQGGIQALSRSYFGKLVPPERSNEYFGFFDIFGKFAAVLGPGLYALVATVTGRSSFAILSIVLLFVIAGLTLLFGGRELRAADGRGRG